MNSNKKRTALRCLSLVFVLFMLLGCTAAFAEGEATLNLSFAKSEASAPYDYIYVPVSTEELETGELDENGEAVTKECPALTVKFELKGAEISEYTVSVSDTDGQNSVVVGTTAEKSLTFDATGLETGKHLISVKAVLADGSELDASSAFCCAPGAWETLVIFLWQYTPIMFGMEGVLGTLIMTLVSIAFAYVIGLPLGIVLAVTGQNGLKPQATTNRVLGFIVNILRSVPFIILLVLLLPFTKIVVGTKLGIKASIVPLVISAAPFVARMVEGSLMEVPYGVIEASRAMGTPNFKIITKTLLPEAMPSLINGCTIAITTLLGYTAMAGYVGGGGLGSIAINYGYYRYNTPVMLYAVVLIILIVQIFQSLGTFLCKSVDKRIR